MHMYMYMYMYTYIYICIEKGRNSARHTEQQHFRESENVLRDVRDTCFDTERDLFRTWDNDRSLLQNIISFTGLFCKRDL